MQTYKNNTEHILAELKWLDLLIRREAEQVREQANGPESVLRGLYMSDGDVDRLLDATESEAAGDELFQQASALSREVEARTASTLAEGTPLALPHVTRLFGLNRFEQQLVVLTLAPEIDPKY
ncbi:MAG TPA: hypothetical protein VFL42_13100, partial [Terriglobales bacterium]|nr:hypothetical protein [Terriglobales bacterium]